MQKSKISKLVSLRRSRIEINHNLNVILACPVTVRYRACPESLHRFWMRSFHSLTRMTFVFIFLTFIFLLLATGVKAQSISLGIYPPLLETTIKPDKSITQVYKIINNGESDLVLTSKILLFQPADEFGNVHLITSDAYKGYSFVDWFSFQNADLQLGDQFVLKAGSEQQVVLKIKIPKDALEDDYYLTLLFETTPAADLYLHSGSGGSEAQIKIGANILLTVSESGEPLKKAKIEEFSLANSLFSRGAGSRFAGKIIDSFSQPQFILRIKNIGKTFFKPNGTIVISGWTKQKYLLDILPENVINNSIRQLQCFSTEYNQPIPCRLTTNWKTKFLIGPYQAQVSFGLDKAGNDYTAKIIFWAIPIKLTLALLTIIFILFIIKSKFKIKT